MEETLRKYSAMIVKREAEALKDAVSNLNAMKSDDDSEMAHGEAEDILCKYLVAIGSKELADAFYTARDRVDFWYA